MVNYLFVRLELVRPNRASVERYSCGTFASQELLTIHEPHFIVLLPVAVSTGIGSETQNPLAIVVIGGLTTATILTLLVFPIIYRLFYRKDTKTASSEQAVALV